MTTMSEKLKEVTINVGVDDGFAETKVAIIEDDGSVRKLSIASRARSGEQGITSVGGLDSGGINPVYETESETITVGDFWGAETAKFDSYPYSNMNRAIVFHALRCAGLSNNMVNIGTGLPIKMFYKNGVPNKELIKKKTDSLKLDIFAKDGGKLPRILSHHVYPEGFAAFIDYAVDTKGNLRVDLDEPVGIIDIGGRTTDIAVVVPRNTVDHARSDSVEIGVLNLLEGLQKTLAPIVGAELPIHMLDKALRTRKLKAFGKEIDIGHNIDDAAAAIFDRIMREVGKKISSGVDLTKILLVGGGSKVFGKVATAFPHIEIPEDPEYANAVGFAKYMLL